MTKPNMNLARVLALGCLVALVVIIYIYALLTTRGISDSGVPGDQVVALAASVLLVIGSIALAALAWSDRLPPLRLLDAAHGLEIFGALLISILELHAYRPAGSLLPGISWVAIWIILIQIQVPSTPAR